MYFQNCGENYRKALRDRRNQAATACFAHTRMLSVSSVPLWLKRFGARRGMSYGRIQGRSIPGSNSKGSMMRKQLGWSLFAVWLLAATTHAQEGAFTIRGRVVDAAAKPVAGVMVRLLAPNVFGGFDVDEKT